MRPSRRRFAAATLFVALWMNEGCQAPRPVGVSQLIERPVVAIGSGRRLTAGRAVCGALTWTRDGAAVVCFGTGCGNDRAAAMLCSRGVPRSLMQAAADFCSGGTPGPRSWRAGASDPRGQTGPRSATPDLADE